MYYKFKKVVMSIIISLLMIFLVSCGTMEVSTNVKVNKDGSSNTVFRLVYDESIKNVVGDGLLQQVLGTETEVNVYSQDNNTVEEVTITTSKINIKDLLKSNALNISNLSYDDGNIIKYDVKREKGVLKDKYTVNIGLTKDLLSEIDANIENEVSNNINNYITPEIQKYLYGNVTSFLIGNVTNTIKNYVAQIPYDLTLSIPFKITESNATAKIDDYTNKWSYTLQDLNTNTEVRLSFFAPNVINIGLSILCAVIIIILIIVLLVRHRKR